MTSPFYQMMTKRTLFMHHGPKSSSPIAMEAFSKARKVHQLTTKEWNCILEVPIILWPSSTILKKNTISIMQSKSLFQGLLLEPFHLFPGLIMYIIELPQKTVSLWSPIVASLSQVSLIPLPIQLQASTHTNILLASFLPKPRLLMNNA